MSQLIVEHRVGWIKRKRVSTTHHCFSVETLRFFHPTNNA
jgi:hypothetical protein